MRDRITWHDNKELVKRRKEGQCPLPHVRMIDPNGFVCDVPVKAGRNVPLEVGMNPQIVVAKKIKAGWKVHSTVKMGPIVFESEFKSEKEREKYIADLKAQRAEHGKKYRDAFDGNNKKLLDAMTRLADQNEGRGG